MSSFGFKHFHELYRAHHVGTKTDLRNLNRKLALDVDDNGIPSKPYTDPQMVLIYCLHIKHVMSGFSNFVYDKSSHIFHLYASSPEQTTLLNQVCGPVDLWPSSAHTIVRRCGHL